MPASGIHLSGRGVQGRAGVSRESPCGVAGHTTGHTAFVSATAFKLEDIEACEAAGVTPYVAKPRRSLAGFAGRFPKSAFHCDEATNTYVCPTGERLSPTYASNVRNMPLAHYVNYQACRACTIQERCTNGAVPCHRALRERGRRRSDGKATRQAPRSLEASKGMRGTSFRLHQAVDGTGGALDAAS